MVKVQFALGDRAARGAFYVAMKLILGRILSAILTAGGWLLAGARTVLDLIGYSTAPEDVGVAQARLDQFFGWLLSVPWWVVWGFALVSTLWLISVSWPRQPRNKDETAKASGSGDIELSATMTSTLPRKVGARPTQDYLHHKNTKIELYKLITSENPTIENRMFENCDILGPIVMLPKNVRFEGKTVFHSLLDIEPVLIKIEPGRIVAGVVEFRNCTFIDCAFRDVGIIVEPDVIDTIRAMFKKP
jgi:hypothetical protein